jgi:hypothetical protein
MLAVIDWNEVLSQAVIGGVLGGIGGGLAALFRKSDAKQHAEFEERERARIHAQMHGHAKDSTKTSWLMILMFPVIIVACVLVVNPSLVTRLFRGGESQPGASSNGQLGTGVSEYGRYRVPGSIRVVPDRTSSSGVSTVLDKDVVLLEQTDQILCQVGETWGIRIRTAELPANRPHTVRQETYHPPLKQADGSVRTKTVREVKVPRGETPKQFYGWHFLKGYESELVAGEWSIVVFIDDVEVARQVFNIRN